jgi:hypothetical protein
MLSLNGASGSNALGWLWQLAGYVRFPFRQCFF